MDENESYWAAHLAIVCLLQLWHCKCSNCERCEWSASLADCFLKKALTKPYICIWKGIGVPFSQLKFHCQLLIHTNTLYLFKSVWSFFNSTQICFSKHQQTFTQYKESHLSPSLLRPWTWLRLRLLRRFDRRPFARCSGRCDHRPCGGQGRPRRLRRLRWRWGRWRKTGHRWKRAKSCRLKSLWSWKSVEFLGF